MVKQHIKHKLCSLDYSNCKLEIKTVDVQDSYIGGVMLFVTGSLTGEDNRTRRFLQTFFLAPQERGYFVHNDVLKYVEAYEPSKNAETSETGDSSTPLIQDQGFPFYFFLSKNAIHFLHFFMFISSLLNLPLLFVAPPHAINPEKLDQAISHEAGGPNVHEHLEEEHLEEERQDWEHLNDSQASENEGMVFRNSIPKVNPFFDRCSLCFSL